jgi:hypothetical protein
VKNVRKAVEIARRHHGHRLAHLVRDVLQPGCRIVLAVDAQVEQRALHVAQHAQPPSEVLRRH